MREDQPHSGTDAAALKAPTVEYALLELADRSATGALLLRTRTDDEGAIYLRTGLLYAASLAGRRSRLGARLLASGHLSPAALDEALEVQRAELPGWRLGELLDHLHHVDGAVVRAFAVESLHETLAELLDAPVAQWRFRAGRTTRADVAPPAPVDALLAAMRARRALWTAVQHEVGGAATVPVLATRGAEEKMASGQVPMDAALPTAAKALLRVVDGVRSVEQLADRCGLSVFQAGCELLELVRGGLLDVPEQPPVPEELPLPEQPPSPGPLPSPEQLPVPDQLPSPEQPPSPEPPPPDDRDADPGARNAVDRASAVAMLRELGLDSDPAQSAGAVEPARSGRAGAPDAANEPALETDPPRTCEPLPESPPPRHGPGLTDTAALMRELSSLGTEQDGGDGSEQLTARLIGRVPQSDARKRKGIFGRG